MLSDPLSAVCIFYLGVKETKQSKQLLLPTFVQTS